MGEGFRLVAAVQSDPILRPFVADLERFARASIRLRPDPSAIRYVGESKVGGKPAVPRDFVWPTRIVEMPDPSPAWIDRQYFAPRLPSPDRRSALTFIAQIDLGAIAPFDSNGILPRDGMLLFFFDDIYQADVVPGDGSSATARYGDDRVFNVDVFGHDVIDQVRVIHVPAGTRIDLSDAGPTTALSMPLSASSDRTLPNVDAYCVAPDSTPPEERSGRVVLSDEAWRRLADLEYEIRANAHIDQMLGWADNGAHGPSLPPSVDGLATVPLADRLSVSEEPRLLLQLDPRTYEKVGIEFGRTLYFYGRGSDLRRGDFSHCWYDSD
jgi:uncharacterized protein YwqG